MKQAIIDIGSNSMHLTAYDVKGNEFRMLFREKFMAGLAGYIESSVLTSEGIECACSGLREFKATLKSLKLQHIHVFATASLRNIMNTEEAVETIYRETGFRVEILSGRDEALLSYYGAMAELELTGGSFIDIGGASTEAVTFENGKPLQNMSYTMGSLSLYKNCVKKILPGETGIKRINDEIARIISTNGAISTEKRTPMVCVGGTARTILKLARKIYGLPQNTKKITAMQINYLYEVLCRHDRETINLILRQAPDRIHTVIPGLLILKQMLELFSADEVIISNYGVREGYLCRIILEKKKTKESTCRTEK